MGPRPSKGERLKIMEKSKWIRRFATDDMYDDGGYCDYKIKKYEIYYWRQLKENGETMCSHCAVSQILHDYPCLEIVENKGE